MNNLGENDEVQTQIAVNSILTSANDQESMEIINNDKISPVESNTNNKRKLEIDHSNPTPDNDRSPVHKKGNIRPIAKYSRENQGPFEVIVQHPEKKRLSPFSIGKILKNNTGIDNVRRTG